MTREYEQNRESIAILLQGRMGSGKSYIRHLLKPVGIWWFDVNELFHIPRNRYYGPETEKAYCTKTAPSSAEQEEFTVMMEDFFGFVKKQEHPHLIVECTGKFDMENKIFRKCVSRFDFMGWIYSLLRVPTATELALAGYADPGSAVLHGTATIFSNAGTSIEFGDLVRRISSLCSGSGTGEWGLLPEWMKEPDDPAEPSTATAETTTSAGGQRIDGTWRWTRGDEDDDDDDDGLPSDDDDESDTSY